MNDEAASLPLTVPHLPLESPDLAPLDSTPPPVPDTVNDPNRTGDWQPAPDSGTVPTTTLPTIPGFVLEKELGRGGMGVVYRARQMPLNRPVALKMILSGDHASAAAKTRFLAEAEAIARLHHPGIVQVHEFGTHQGNPYFALEFLDGGSLDRVLVKGPLLPPDAARLVAQLADAMHAAHQAGIVHRDLKPANVLLSFSGAPQARVDDSPAHASGARLNDATPKITDFGLAKQIDAGPGLTASGAIMGTPSYMAPEQAAGKLDDIGPTTDVYALGAILYECVTGRPPFRGATVFDTLDMVLRQEPVSVRQLQPKAPKDLETICHKCLQKDQGKRYGSAVALAADLRNYLDGKPITARPVGRLERTWKWCRRYPAVTALIVVSTLAALVASGLAAWALHAEGQERLAKLDADQKRQVAEKAEEETYQAFEQLTSEKSLRFLKKVEKLSPEQREFLQSAAAYFRRVTAQAGTDEKSRVRAAEGHFQLGYLLSTMGENKPAEAAYREALAVRETLAQDYPTVPEYRQQLARSHNNLGVLLKDLGQWREAETAYRQALPLEEALARDFPTVPAYRQALADSYNNLGTLLSGLGKRREAEIAYRQALALQEALVRDFPTVPEYRQALAGSHNNLGSLLAGQGQRMAAAVAFRQALAQYVALARDFPTVTAYRQALATSYNNLGSLLAEQGQRMAAAAAFRQALALQEALAGDFPTVPEYRLELARSHYNLGLLLRVMGQLREAESAYRQALALQEALARDFPTVSAYRQELARSYGNIGYLVNVQGRLAEALLWHTQAVPVLEGLLRQEPRDVTTRKILRNAHWSRANALADLGRFAEAVTAWELTHKFNDEASHTTFIKNHRAATMLLAGMYQDYAWPLLWGWPRW